MRKNCIVTKLNEYFIVCGFSEVVINTMQRFALFPIRNLGWINILDTKVVTKGIMPSERNAAGEDDAIFVTRRPIL